MLTNQCIVCNMSYILNVLVLDGNLRAPGSELQRTLPEIFKSRLEVEKVSSRDWYIEFSRKS